LAHGADYVWLLNNDAVVEPDSLSKLIATASQDQNIGLISPLAYDYYDRDRIQFCGVLADMSRQKFTYAPDPPTPHPGGSSPQVLLWGIALLVRSSVIRRIGYLDDRYFAYHEDLDYSLRAIGAGFRTLVEPTAVVYHKWSRSSGEGSPFKTFLSVRNMYLFWTTYLEGVPKYAYLPRYLAWALQQAISFKESGNQLAADACLDGAWSAIRGRYGPPHSTTSMPRSTKTILYAHPQLWIWMLRGQVWTICHAVAARLRHRI
jgi:GT2 family glycosyltransferase